MNGFTVEFARSARQELERLPQRIVQRAMRAIRRLQDNARPPGYRKLAGAESTYRIRVGQYRVVYELDDLRGLVLITRIRHRNDAYQ